MLLTQHSKALTFESSIAIKTFISCLFPFVFLEGRIYWSVNLATVIIIVACYDYNWVYTFKKRKIVTSYILNAALTMRQGWMNIKWTINRDIPVLHICAGVQVIFFIFWLGWQHFVDFYWLLPQNQLCHVYIWRSIEEEIHFN